MDHSKPASLHLITSWSLPKFMFIALVMPSSHLILWCHPLLLPTIFPSVRNFSNELDARIRWTEYWTLSFSISPSNEYSGLICFKIDWFHLLAVQGTFSSLLQHHSLKASILWCSALFMVQVSQWHMNTGKTIALTIQTFVSRGMSLLYNILYRFVTAFLPRSNYPLNSWLQSPSTVILEPNKSKSITTSTFSFYMPRSNGTGCHDFSWFFFTFSFKPCFSLFSLTLIKRLFSSPLLLPLVWYHLHIWGCWCFSCLSLFQLAVHPAWHFS